MAHFAELESKTDPTGFTSDTHQVVKRVVVVANDIEANGGTLGDNDCHVDGETWCSNFFKGGSWKQTSYNNNFRKQYCGNESHFYDSFKDKFIELQPFPSWYLDNNDDWQPPVNFPNTVDIGGLRANATWDEDNRRWIGRTFDHTTDPVTETPYVWDATNLQWNEG